MPPRTRRIGGGMRWDELFADLEAQLAAEAAAEQDAEVADRTRREAARLTLVDRALGAVGCRVAVRVPGAGDVLGVLREVGAEWLLVDEDGGRTTLVPLAACLAVTGLTARTDLTTSAGRVFARLGLGAALRAVARDRSAVSVWLVDGSAVSGTVDRVGADFVEVSERPADDYPARATAVRTVPFAAIGLVRSQR